MRLPYLGEFRITKLYGTPPPPGMTYSAGKHAGIDLVGTSDKIVRAVNGGIVYKASIDYDGWGKYIVVKQDDGYYAIYCHLKSAYKAAGSVVRAGDMIGLEGSTGKSAGSHLHFELRKVYSDKYSTIDPAPYLDLENKVGIAKAVQEVLKKITITENGVDKKVNAIEREGNNYVKLQDLRDSRIAIGYANGKPTITVVK